jgi:hypothetical protein
MSADEPEWRTRKQRIDPRLDARGWSRAKSGSTPIGRAYRTEEEETDNGPADYALCLFELPANPKIQLIAVALGAADACREHFGGGSGSPVIAPGTDGTAPFTVGDIDATKPFVHVLNEASLDLLLGELDTIDDFVRYFTAKESFVRSGRLVSATGEEDLLAYYLQRTDDTGRHAFVFAGNPDGVGVDELWDAFSKSPEYRAKKQADQISYLWDRMIESVAKCATEGRLVTGNEFPLQDHERGLRLLASEPRVVRRGLSKSLRDVLSRSDAQDLFARAMPASDDRDHGYVFLTIKRQAIYGSEDRYRAFRQQTLLHYCHTVKLRQPTTSLLVGLAFGAESERDGSIDMLLREFTGWTEEDSTRADEMRRKYGWSADGSDLLKGSRDGARVPLNAAAHAHRREGEVGGPS